MSSLSVHLRLPEDHSRLPFHPSCPVCRRDRLAGSLEGDEIVSRRTQAAIAVGLLAFSGVGAPAAAVAAGPDQDIDGSAEVIQSPDPEADVDETTTGWADGGPAPADDEPLELVPETEEASPEPVSRAPAEEPVSEVADEVEDPNAVTEPAPEPVAIAAPPTSDPIATTEAAASDGIRVDTAERAKRERPVEHTKPAVQPRVIAAPVPVAARTTTSAVTVRVAAGTNQSTIVRATDGARFHVVQRGESLWSIASDRLGERAGVAQVAGEVDRLWQLNEDRIASGSPDLLYAGTRLRLR
jgi:LysM domain